jgi:hypothetical protein
VCRGNWSEQGDTSRRVPWDGLGMAETRAVTHGGKHNGAGALTQGSVERPVLGGSLHT